MAVAGKRLGRLSKTVGIREDLMAGREAQAAYADGVPRRVSKLVLTQMAFPMPDFS